MGGETEAQVSPWTVDSLKEYLEGKISDLVVRLDERKQAQDEAIEQRVGETARALIQVEARNTERAQQWDARLAQLNEIRGQLNDQANTFLTKETYDIAHKSLESKVGTIENLITGLVAKEQGAKEQVTEKRQDNSSKIGMIVAVATVINIVFVLVANGVFK